MCHLNAPISKLECDKQVGTNGVCLSKDHYFPFLAAWCENIFQGVEIKSKIHLMFLI